MIIPCEEHFKTVKERAALSTTAPLLGILEKYNIEIPWMKKAEEIVWKENEQLRKNMFSVICAYQDDYNSCNTPEVEIQPKKALNNLKNLDTNQRHNL
ncbi:MAG: hypothetical protein BalsKO_17080 [Balneolaceae bacterium]